MICSYFIQLLIIGQLNSSITIKCMINLLYLDYIANIIVFNLIIQHNVWIFNHHLGTILSIKDKDSINKGFHLIPVICEICWTTIYIFNIFMKNIFHSK